jgi:hypothetical protein
MLVLLMAMAAWADASVGTWERNAEKSKVADGFTRQTMVREAMAGGVRVTIISEAADAKKVEMSYGERYDGSAALVKGAPAGCDTIATRHADERTMTFEARDSRGGRCLMTGRTVVAKNGQKMVTKQEGVGADGKPVRLELVFDRVK